MHVYVGELSNGGGHVSRESTIGTTKSYDRTYEYHNVEKCKFHRHTTTLLLRGPAFSTLCAIISINIIVSFVLPTGSERACCTHRSGHFMGGLTFFDEKPSQYLTTITGCTLPCIISVQVTHSQALIIAKRLRYSTGN